MCREEAAELSSLKPEIEKTGAVLHAVVHEELGVPEFQTFFDGDIYLDVDKTFYGPTERRSSMLGLLRAGVIRNIMRVKGKKIPGNMQGDGFLLGGSFVLGPGEKGILFEYREKEFGDHADKTEILNAAQSIKSEEN